MSMDLPSLMMLGGVVVGMRVDERSPQGRRLDGQCEREGDYLPHGVLIVRDPTIGRQGKLDRTPAVICGPQSGILSGNHVGPEGNHNGQVSFRFVSDDGCRHDSAAAKPAAAAWCDGAHLRSRAARFV